MVKFSNTTPLPPRIFWGGGMNNFFDPPLSTKSFNDGGGERWGLFLTSIYKPNIKKWIFSATVHLIRKVYISQ